MIEWGDLLIEAKESFEKAPGEIWKDREVAAAYLDLTDHQDDQKAVRFVKAVIDLGKRKRDEAKGTIMQQIEHDDQKIEEAKFAATDPKKDLTSDMIGKALGSDQIPSKRGADGLIVTDDPDLVSSKNARIDHDSIEARKVMAESITFLNDEIDEQGEEKKD